uniref:Uncharacterized protein n=1 Tax=Ovis aries TaxID=9940 RepID=A0AC11E724_SHEEP
MPALSSLWQLEERAQAQSPRRRCQWRSGDCERPGDNPAPRTILQATPLRPASVGAGPFKGGETAASLWGWSLRALAPRAPRPPPVPRAPPAPRALCELPAPHAPGAGPRDRSVFSRRHGPGARGERPPGAMIRLRGWCSRTPRGAAGPAGRRWASGGPAGRALRVLVDMDGVLADFEGGFLRKFRARFPDQPFIALEDRRGFWVSEQYGRLQPGLSEKAISIWESENFFFDLEPLPGAVEAVKQMANLESTDVFICTSPIKMYKYCPFEKYAWVEKHFGPDFLEQMVLTRDKTVVSADLLIDDRVDITGAEPNPSWEHVLFTACHNRHTQLQPPSRRLHSWADDWRAILDSKRTH